MNSLNEQHQQAMELAEQAFIARRRDDLVAARTLAYRAFVLEKQAAELAQTEPTRSVLHRSAATLALDCGEYREAERLVASPGRQSSPTYRQRITRSSGCTLQSVELARANRSCLIMAASPDQ